MCGLESLIQLLRSRSLLTVCPECEHKFSLAEAVLFDGMKPFPPEAQESCKSSERDLAERRAALRIRKISLPVRIERTTKSVGFGTVAEQFAPVLEGFNYNPGDCRALFDPIDFLVFDGLGSSNVRLITFLEIKTGGATLGPHQEMVRTAIEKERVFYQEV